MCEAVAVPDWPLRHAVLHVLLDVHHTRTYGETCDIYTPSLSISVQLLVHAAAAIPLQPVWVGTDPGRLIMASVRLLYTC